MSGDPLEMVTFPPSPKSPPGGSPQRDRAAAPAPRLDEYAFESLFDTEGRMVDPISFRRAIFACDVCPMVRTRVWCYLFGLYEASSTRAERLAVLDTRRRQYDALVRRWHGRLRQRIGHFDLRRVDNYIIDTEHGAHRAYSCTNSHVAEGGSGANESTSCATDCDDDDEQQAGGSATAMDVHARIYAARVRVPDELLDATLRVVAKDVPRTERSHELFQADDSEHLLAIRDALVSFALVEPDIGYVQGMNDLMARFQAVVGVAMGNAAAFWCFHYFIKHLQAENFDAQYMLPRIDWLRQLVETLDPDLYHYLHQLKTADMLFAHRWLLLFFQREFTFAAGVRLLEVLSSRHLELNSAPGAHRLSTLRRSAEARSGERLSSVSEHLLCDKFSFDLFVAAAILIGHRDALFAAADGTHVHMIMTNVELNLDDVLALAERLFNRYCKQSVMNAFVLL